eukprot:7072995-Prymnesium_polylepis.1
MVPWKPCSTKRRQPSHGVKKARSALLASTSINGAGHDRPGRATASAQLLTPFFRRRRRPRSMY